MNSKILMVGWGYPPKIDGGLDVHVKHIFEELKDLGADIDLVLPEERAPDRTDIIQVDAGEGSMVQKARNISQEVAKISKEYDIIHTHDWFGSEAGFKSQKYSDVDWVSTVHSLSFQRARNGSGELKKMEKVAAENSDILIAVSNSLASKIEAEFGVNPEVVHNGFSTPDSSGINPRKRHGVEGEMLFFVGRHSDQKGIENLIYGFKKLLGDRNATLVIGGEGHRTKALEKFVEILGIQENVVFTGFIPEEELGDYYRAADVFVSPSIDEPFGLTITEALESGTPVVATESGATEIIGSGIEKVDPNSRSIKEGVEKVLEEGADVDYERRSWKDVAEETMELYKGLNS